MTIGSKIIFISNLTSTNTHALNLILSERPAEGTLIRTDFQSEGRGQPGNSWDSEKGKNLLFSIILYPSRITPGKQFMISMALSLGVHDYLSQLFEGCSIKWPNDIYIKDDKIAGILIESAIMGKRVEYMVAGIGLNVNQQEFRSNIPNPISMKNLSGMDYDPETCLSDLAEMLDNRYRELQNNRSFGRIRQEYISKLYRLNIKSQYYDSNGRFTGTIIGVDSMGFITIEDDKGSKRRYSFKEVEFIH